MAPVTKQSVMSEDNALVKEAYRKAEEYINRILTLTGSCTYDLDTALSGKARLKAALVDLLTSAYEKAGWIVVRNNGSDWRNDSWDNLVIS